MHVDKRIDKQTNGLVDMRVCILLVYRVMSVQLLSEGALGGIFNSLSRGGKHFACVSECAFFLFIQNKEKSDQTNTINTSWSRQHLFPHPVCGLLLKINQTILVCQASKHKTSQSLEMNFFFLIKSVLQGVDVGRWTGRVKSPRIIVQKAGDTLFVIHKAPVQDWWSQPTEFV